MESLPPTRPSRLRELVRPFRTPGLRRLIIAFFIAELGDGVVAILLPLGVYEATSSPFLTGLSFAIVRGAGVVARPIGGVMADRLERIGLLRMTFLVRVGMLATALWQVETRPSLGLVIILGASLVGSFDNPAAEASIRVLARDAIQQVATVRKTAFSISYLLGPAIGGIAISLGDLTAGVLVAVVAFAIGAMLLTGLRSAPDAQVSPLTMADAISSAISDSRAGFGHIRSSANLRGVALASFVHGLLVSAMITVAVIYLAELPDTPAGAFGLAVAAYSTGSVVGLIVAGASRWRIELRTLFWRAMLVYGFLAMASVVSARWEVLAGAWLVWGVAFGPEEILSDVVTVRETPDRLLGRTYAGMGMAMIIGDAVGALAGGALGEVFTPRTLIVAIGVLYMVPMATWFAARSRRLALAS